MTLPGSADVRIRSSPRLPLSSLHALRLGLDAVLSSSTTRATASADRPVRQRGPAPTLTSLQLHRDKLVDLLSSCCGVVRDAEASLRLEDGNEQDQP